MQLMTIVRRRSTKLQYANDFYRNFVISLNQNRDAFVHEGRINRFHQITWALSTLPIRNNTCEVGSMSICMGYGMIEQIDIEIAYACRRRAIQFVKNHRFVRTPLFSFCTIANDIFFALLLSSLFIKLVVDCFYLPYSLYHSSKQVGKKGNKDIIIDRIA